MVFFGATFSRMNTLICAISPKAVHLPRVLNSSVTAEDFVRVFVLEERPRLDCVSWRVSPRGWIKESSARSRPSARARFYAAAERSSSMALSVQTDPPWLLW
jgi:hypothetical protein